MTNTPLANSILHRYIAQPGAIPRGAAEQISGRVLRLAEGSLPLLSLLQRRGQVEIGDLWAGPSAEYAWVRRQTVTATPSIAEFSELPRSVQKNPLPVVRPLPKDPSAPILGEAASPAAAQIDAARASLVVQAPKAAAEDRPIGDSSTTDASLRPVVRPAPVQRAADLSSGATAKRSLKHKSPTSLQGEATSNHTEVGLFAATSLSAPPSDQDNPGPAAALGSSILRRHPGRRVTQALAAGNTDISTIRAAADVARSVTGALAAVDEIPAPIAPDAVHLSRHAEDTPHIDEAPQSRPARAVVRAQQPPPIQMSPQRSAAPMVAPVQPTPASPLATGDASPKQAATQPASGSTASYTQQPAPAPHNAAPTVQARTAATTPTGAPTAVLVQRPVRQVQRGTESRSTSETMPSQQKGQSSTKVRLLAREDHPRTTQKSDFLQRTEAMPQAASDGFASSTAATHVPSPGTRTANATTPQPPSISALQPRSTTHEPLPPLTTRRQIAQPTENSIAQEGANALAPASFSAGSPLPLRLACRVNCAPQGRRARRTPHPRRGRPSAARRLCNGEGDRP
ncbi:MAG: hypothetical protein R2873_06075 [Caldilineaceae bacterium]